MVDADSKERDQLILFFARVCVCEGCAPIPCACTQMWLACMHVHLCVTAMWLILNCVWHILSSK